jgi:hypothetical protein
MTRLEKRLLNKIFNLLIQKNQIGLLISAAAEEMVSEAPVS